MNLINKLLCKLLGHKFVPKLKDMYCIRCGTSRQKTFSEYLSYDSLFAKMLSEERYKKYIFNELQQLHKISQKKNKGDAKEIGNTVKIHDCGNISSGIPLEQLTEEELKED